MMEHRRSIASPTQLSLGVKQTVPEEEEDQPSVEKLKRVLSDVDIEAANHATNEPVGIPNVSTLGPKVTRLNPGQHSPLVDRHKLRNQTHKRCCFKQSGT
jgi:hypothetical protein